MEQPESHHRRDGRCIEAEVRTSAPAEEVWKAWTDPAGIAAWFVDEARGEARPGKTLVWSFRGFGEVPYPVVVAAPPERLILAGEIPGRGQFALEIQIRASGGETVVRLVNSGFLDGAEWAEEYEGVRSGWIGSLALLKHYLERHRGEPRRAALLLRPVPAGPVEVYRHYGAPDALAAWLTRSGGLGEAGEPARLTLQGGEPLTGRVLAATGREKAVSWEEEDGSVVELKSFATPAGRMAGLRLTTWGDPARVTGLERALSPAVERLAAALGGER